MSVKKEVMENLAEAMKAIYTFDVGEKFTVVDLMVLAEVYCKPGITLTETMNKFAGVVPLTTIQNSFIGFDRNGLIDKKPHPTEYRAKAIFLNKKGEELISRITGALK